jgi:hypothetical protein
MSKSGLMGPYRLTFEGIDCAVTRRSAGVYALGHAAADGRFHVHHVGRSDEDIKSHLRDRIGSAMQFKYEYAATSRAAFERECELFHDLRPAGNRIHPGRAARTSWECPRCRIYAHGRPAGEERR